MVNQRPNGHEGSFSIGSRLIINFRFEDSVVVIAEGTEEEADVLVDLLDTTIISYNMEIGPDTTKVTSNTQNGFQGEVRPNCQRLEAVENFKYV